MEAEEDVSCSFGFFLFLKELLFSFHKGLILRVFSITCSDAGRISDLQMFHGEASNGFGVGVIHTVYCVNSV